LPEGDVVNEHRNEENDNLLERAVAAMRDEALPELSGSLVERTQSAVRDELRAGDRAVTFSPFRHPLLRIAAAIALATTLAAAFLVFRHSGPSQVATSEPARPTLTPIASEVRDPKNDVPNPPVVVPPQTTDPALTGVVHFNGVAPKPQVLSMAANAACAAHHRGQVVDESVLVNGDGTLRNVVVWISQGLEGRTFAPPRDPAVLDQQGCVYTPHVVTVMTGQRLLVKNSDPFLHNVRAAAVHNPPFNFGQPSVDVGGTPLTFLTPDRMFVKCDVHPWMTAHILVLDNPYFAVTGERGTFKLPELPPGTYTVSAWHEVYGEQKQRVTVEPGRPLSLDFTFRPTENARADGVRTLPRSCCNDKPHVPIALASGL
jgi:hypothetical protein